MSEIAETLHRKEYSYPKALRLITRLLSTQDGKNLPKSLGLMKIHTLQQSHFSALPGPALILLVFLKCISSVSCFSPLSNNQMHFLFTSPALMPSTFCACLRCLPSDLSGSSYFPLPCCWRDRVLLAVFLG